MMSIRFYVSTIYILCMSTTSSSYGKVVKKSNSGYTWEKKLIAFTYNYNV